MAAKEGENMHNQPYAQFNTIAASNLSRCGKWLLTTLLVEAADTGSCRISLSTLAQLTSTSPRHLSRILRMLSDQDLIRITHRPGRCNTYNLAPLYSLRNDQLLADWTAERSSYPRRQKPRQEWLDASLIDAWSSAFSTRYRPITEQEQWAMDFMLYAHSGRKLVAIKYPVAYLKTLVRNGHPEEFLPFQERRRKKRTQSYTKKSGCHKEQEELDRAWSAYKRLPESQQKDIERRFADEVIQRSKVRQVADLFQQNGTKHPLIKSLYRAYVSQRSARAEGIIPPARSL